MSPFPKLTRHRPQTQDPANLEPKLVRIQHEHDARVACPGREKRPPVARPEYGAAAAQQLELLIQHGT